MNYGNKSLVIENLQLFLYTHQLVSKFPSFNFVAAILNFGFSCALHNIKNRSAEFLDLKNLGVAI